MSEIGIGGYAGKFLRVDLTGEHIIEEKADEETLRKYIGGTGMGIKFLYEEVPPGVEWSDPENRLILAAGPLNGTRIGGSGSFSVVTKGPLTNGSTSVQANGFFGAYLKFCGFDGIIVQGASKRWVYLYIDDGGVAELRGASHLVGKDTYETEDLIKQELGKKEREMSVVSIGPAGENLVKFAVIFADKGHVAAHNGPGAVMGSKKLKAIVVARGKKRVVLRDKEELAKIAEKLFNDVKTLDKKTYDWGTLWAILQANEDGWLPVKNYTTSVWPIDKDKLARFTPEAIREHFEGKLKPCWACRLHHCHMIRIPDGPYAGLITEEPEYEQFASWAPQIGNTDVNATVMLSKEVDRLGLDTNEAGWVIGFVMECYEKGIITKEDTNGLEMTWGNVEATRSMLNMIARREGFGNVLAEGVMQAAKHIGGEAVNLAVHTRRGTTPRSHDHRGRPKQWEMFYTCVSNTGTGRVAGGQAVSGPLRDRWKELSTTVAKTQVKMNVEDSMVTCAFNTRCNIGLLSRAVSAVTGWDFTREEAINAGLRITNLLRAFNIRHGLTSDLDYPSPRYGSTPVDGKWKGEGMMPYWDKMLRNYYTELGWEKKTGKPLPETLKKLGLEHVVKGLWGGEQEKA